MNPSPSRETEALTLLGCHRYLSREQIEVFVLEGAKMTANSRRVVAKRILHRLRQRGFDRSHASFWLAASAVERHAWPTS